MMQSTHLKGITWAHSRGITPLQAVSQRYSELHPGVHIEWVTRSLQQFADYPIEVLTKDYDLLIIDHPWVGCAAATNTVLPLDQYLSKDYLLDQEKNAVGQSYNSYVYDGQLWALPIDAAAPAASFRKDLFDRSNTALPQTWEEVIELAKKGKVAVPVIPIDLLMNFYTFCIAHGETPFTNEQEVISPEVGISALATMKELYSLVDAAMFKCNPIAVAEAMSTTDNYWYCPFAYCYSNYSRKGFAKHLLHYCDVVSYNGTPLQTTIGGTGIAVSSSSNQKEIALDLATLLVSSECQQHMYVQHGGQPGHRAAWLTEDANQLTDDFFKNLLPLMDRGYMRPRYNGYLLFQDHGGKHIQRFLKQNISPRLVLEKLNSIYRQSLGTKNKTFALC